MECNCRAWLEEIQRESPFYTHITGSLCLGSKVREIGERIQLRLFPLTVCVFVCVWFACMMSAVSPHMGTMWTHASATTWKWAPACFLWYLFSQVNVYLMYISNCDGNSAAFVLHIVFVNMCACVWVCVLVNETHLDWMFVSQVYQCMSGNDYFGKKGGAAHSRRSR